MKAILHVIYLRGEILNTSLIVKRNSLHFNEIQKSLLKLRSLHGNESKTSFLLFKK